MNNNKQSSYNYIHLELKPLRQTLPLDYSAVIVLACDFLVTGLSAEVQLWVLQQINNKMPI